jgi:hypothetical protein
MPALFNQKREILFELFSNNLKHWLIKKNLKLSTQEGGEFKKIDSALFICPLCLHGFTVESLNQSYPNPLTIEHVPPKSVGGKPLMLLCKKCNSTQGYSLDQAIQTMIEREPFLNMQPDSSITGKINLFDDSRLPLRIVRDIENRLIYQIDTKGNSYIENRLLELFSRNETKSAKFDINLPDKKQYSIAVLRAGYLLAFNYFGYDFLFGENISIFREQFNHPKNKILPHSGLINNDGSALFREGIHLITSPEDFKSYVVIFKTRKGNLTKNNVIFMPGPGRSGWERYKNLKSLNSSITLSLSELPSLEILKDPKLVDGYSHIWDNLV